MPRHIRDFSALCDAKFESQLEKRTETNKRNRPKLGRTARKFLLCGRTIQFKIYYSYGFGSWEVNKEDVTVITHVVRSEVLFFFGFKSSYRRSFYMALILSDVKFWDAMGEEISFHTAFLFDTSWLLCRVFTKFRPMQVLFFPPFVQPTPVALKWNANSSLQMSHRDLY